jgi:hypothetical protein
MLALPHCVVEEEGSTRLFSLRLQFFIPPLPPQEKEETVLEMERQLVTAEGSTGYWLQTSTVCKMS